MTAIPPIPASRVGDYLAHQRLIDQLQNDQRDLLQLETQVSTGQRLVLPSDDPAAAQRGIQLEQLINRQAQFSTNLKSSQTFLTATDSALSSVFNQLTNIQSVAQSVATNIATNDQRAAAAAQVAQAIKSLLAIGNQQFNGNYLFAGSKTSVQPFSSVGNYIAYNGNQGSLGNYSDVNQVYQTNIDGNTAFGAISSSLNGSADLNPVVTLSTPLSELNGGNGITKGGVAISDGTNISNVDLSGAHTIGDVVQLLQSNPPLGRIVTAAVTSTGLNVSLDAAGGGNLTIKELGYGTTAKDLGIVQTTGVGTGTVVGQDLNPALIKTTSLGDILGTRASVRVNSSGNNNDLVFQAQQNGVALNGVSISFVNNPAIDAGHETVAYDAIAHTLTFQVSAGATSGRDIVNALNNDPVAGQVFRASLVQQDTSNKFDAGSGVIDSAATGTTAGGSGINFDKSSGLQIVSGGQTYQIDLSSANTIEDVLNAINGSGSGVLAQINATGTGIDLHSKLSGADFSVGENGGQTATQLGLRSLTANTQLADLNHGFGVQTAQGNNDFSIQRPDGTSFEVSVTGAQTIGDVLNLINNNANNQNPTNKVTAQLATVGNGIELVTPNNSATASLAVLSENSSTAAADLGLVPAGASISNPATVSGGIATLTGADQNPQEVSGAFNALIRLQQALTTNNEPQIQRSISLLTSAETQVSAAQAEVGTREQAVSTLQSQLANQTTTAQSAKSQDLDSDLTQVISDLTARQTSLQATLQVTAAISKLSLLNYL